MAKKSMVKAEEMMDKKSMDMPAKKSTKEKQIERKIGKLDKEISKYKK